MEGITDKLEIFETGLEGAGILSQEIDGTETSGKETTFLRFLRQWGPLSLDKKRLGLLWLGVVCQAATVGITQPLWLVRVTPPNLPTFSVPDFDFLGPLYLSLLLTLFVPRPGMALHWAILILAGVFDQYRLQPQFYALAVLMSVCVWSSWHTFTRWFLISTWLWAGFHKLLSADWFGHASYWLVHRAEIEGAKEFHVVIAVLIALIEIAVGILACVKPRWATVGCVLMHVGIIVSLSPWILNWNESVLPWNLAMAVIGGWVMWTSTDLWPKTNVQCAIAVAWMVLPMGFFVGWMDHGFSGVLYSDSLPRGQVTTVEGTRRINGWGDLHVPFPNERRTLRMYFEQSSRPGDFLHISDPRILLNDQFFVLNNSGVAQEIAEMEFYSGEAAIGGGPQFGVGLDELRSIFALRQAGVKMLSRKPGAPIYAVAFTPENYEPVLLESLKGLPNLEQVQLAGTAVSNADLVFLRPLRMLTGVGLDQTKVSDEGIRTLQRLPYLRAIECDGTAVSEECLHQVLGR